MTTDVLARAREWLTDPVSDLDTQELVRDLLAHIVLLDGTIAAANNRIEALCQAHEEAYLRAERCEDWGWRDIASAPKSRTTLLLSNGQYVHEAYWALNMWCWASGAYNFPDPTHWMPLPAPPERPGETR